MFASADQVAIATLLANKAVERSITHKLEDARDAVFNKMVEILQAYKSSMTAAGAGASAQLAISENLKILPVLVLGLLKNVRTCLFIVNMARIADPGWLSGWDQAKRPNPARSQGVRAVPPYHAPPATPHSVPLPHVLLVAQHATRGETLVYHCCYDVLIISLMYIVRYRWGARNHHASAPSSHFRTTRASRSIPD